MPTISELERRRKSVEWFSNIMFEKLTRDVDKGDWSNDQVSTLLIKMKMEFDELCDALLNGTPEEIARECADVSNYAMIIAQVVNGGAGR